MTEALEVLKTDDFSSRRQSEQRPRQLGFDPVADADRSPYHAVRLMDF